jgi:hypothetical protein
MTDIQTDIQTDTQTYRQTKRKKYMLTDGWTDRQMFQHWAYKRMYRQIRQGYIK